MLNKIRRLFLINKNIFVIKNILLTVLKIDFLIYIIFLLAFIPTAFIINYSNKLHALVNFIYFIFPLIILYFVFLSAFLFGISFFEKTEIFDEYKKSIPKPTKIWDLKQNKLISDPNILINNYPVVTSIFLFPKVKPGKKLLLMSYLPIELLKKSNFILIFINAMRLKVPTTFELGETIFIPHGGLFNKKTQVPGDLIIQMNPLSKFYYYIYITIQSLCLLIPAIIFFVLQ